MFLFSHLDISSSVPKSCLTLCDAMHFSGTLCCHGLRHIRPPCSSLSPGVCWNSCPLSWRFYLTISFSATLFSFCPQSFPASVSFPISWLFTSCGESIGAAASILPMNSQGWFPLGLSGWISVMSKGLSRVFFSTTVWKHLTLAPMKVSYTLCVQRWDATHIPPEALKTKNHPIFKLGISKLFSCNLRLPVTPGPCGFMSLYNSVLWITALTLQNCFCFFGNEYFPWPVKRVLGNCSTLSLHFGRTGKEEGQAQESVNFSLTLIIKFKWCHSTLIRITRYENEEEMASL